MIYSNNILSLKGNPISFESVEGGWRSYVQKDYLQKFCQDDPLHIQLRVDTDFRDCVFLRIKKCAFSNGKYIKDGEVVFESVFTRTTLSNGYEFLDCSVDLTFDYGIYFCEVITQWTSNLILADSNLFSICRDWLRQDSVLLKYKNSENNYDMFFGNFLKSEMGGIGLKKFIGPWVNPKPNVSQSIYFENKNYYPDGSEQTSTTDNLIISIYDDSPYLKKTIHSAKIESDTVEVYYRNTEHANLNIADGDTSFTIYNKSVSALIPFSTDYSGTDFSVTGSSIQVMNDMPLSMSGVLKMKIHSDAVLSVVSGSLSVGNNENVYITPDMCSFDSINNNLNILIPFLFNINNDQLDHHFTFLIDLPGVFNGTINWLDGGNGTSFGKLEKREENIYFYNYLDDTFSITNNIITFLKNGSLKINGTYVIRLTFENPSGIINPTNGSIVISGSGSQSPVVEITKSMWNITNNIAIINVPINCDLEAIINNTIQLKFILEIPYSNNGGVFVSSFDNFDLKLTEPQTSYIDGVNFDFLVVGTNGEIFKTFNFHKNEIQKNSQYKFSIPFETFSQIPSNVIDFEIYEIRELDSKTLISNSETYYVNDSNFINPTTRFYNGMPFYFLETQENWFYKRVEGKFNENEVIFKTDYSSFDDQKAKPINIYANPVMKKTLTLSGLFVAGLPNFELSKLIAIFAFDTVFVDGEQMSRSEDDDIEISRENMEYGFGIFKIVLVPSLEYMIEKTNVDENLLNDKYSPLLNNSTNITI